MTTGGGAPLSQSANAFLKELSSGKERAKAAPPAQTSFQDVLSQQGGGKDVAKLTAEKMIADTQVAPEVARAARQREQQIAQKLSRTTVGRSAAVKDSQLMTMLRDLIKGQDEMDKIMRDSLSGRQFGPSELLAMQVGVYRFSQELDLTSKVVEKGTGGIKQTINTQV